MAEKRKEKSHRARGFHPNLFIVLFLFAGKKQV
jgi:hypothetical protein